ncbi:MAG: LptE family protein [Bdellovibrionales bacterium]
MISTLILFSAPGCAYRFGLSERKLPGGYNQVAIPIFKNKSTEVGVEPLFTNALIRGFERSQAAKIADKESSPVVLEGTINRIDTIQGATKDSKNLLTLPSDSVLVSEYRLRVFTQITLKRKSDEKIIWQGGFSNEKVYSSPVIGTAIVNSANATYNQSARMQAIALLAEEMMTEAHDRITENY